MNDKARRKELQAQYRQAPPEAGVYRLVNTQTQKTLLASAVNLASARNKLDFARSTNSPGALDVRLAKDIREFGLDAFTFEVLETIQPKPETTPEELRSELATLEELWREKLGSADLY